MKAINSNMGQMPMMDAMRLSNQTIKPQQHDTNVGTSNIGTPTVEKSKAPSFSAMLENYVENVNGEMKGSDAKIEDFISGGETSIHEVMTAMTKADVSFRLMTQVGRKVVEAYQEIMRMQV